MILAIQGFGFGLLTPPVLVAGLSDLPAPLVSQGTAVRSLLNQVSGAIAVALLGAVVATSAGANPTPSEAQSAYNNAFAVAAVGVLIAVVLAVRLPSRRPSIEIEHLDEVLVLESRARGITGSGRDLARRVTPPTIAECADERSPR